MNRPVVSVLMSIFNEPLAWICLAIDSILEQTFANFEFIIINDNPKRLENIDLLNKVSKKDSRVIIVTNEDNIGLTRSLNIGLQIAKGKYVARMDADDISLKNRFEVQYNYMENNPFCIACGSFAYIINNEKFTSKKIKMPVGKDHIFSYMFASNPFIHPTLFFRNSGVRYDESFKKAQDYKLVVDLIEKGELNNINIPLLYYRKSPSQITVSCSQEQQFLATQIRRIFINRYYEKIGLDILTNDAITLLDIKKNRNCKCNLYANEYRFFKMNMNAIRRTMYYSLDRYSLCAFFYFIYTCDYLKYPYDLRKFSVILLKFVRIKVFRKLL